ncbi:MAG: ABC-type transport system involved in cytochrome c biogenesis permease subunit [Planctomycetota bacterium]|jgi:ABC-type transport system involved in cytochrome c biogenesis permease subunit
MIRKTIAMLLTLVTLCTSSAWAQEAASAPEKRTQPWTAETINLFAGLPMQDRGRVKPLDQYAALQLLTFNGKRTLAVDEDTKLKPTEWLLDCFFFPEQAKDYPCFRVSFDGVVNAIGVEAKNKLDWYSYNEIQVGRFKLNEEARAAGSVDPAEQTTLQRQTLNLANNVFAFENLIATLEPLRWKYSTSGSKPMEETFEKGVSSLSEVLAQSSSLARMAETYPDQGSPEFKAAQGLYSQMATALQMAQGTAAIYPAIYADEDDRTWLSLADLISASFEDGADTSKQRLYLAKLEAMEAAKGDPAAFEEELNKAHSEVVPLTIARGEYKHIPLELMLYRLDPFTNALVFFILGFVLIAFGWLAPKNKWLLRGIWACVLIGATLTVTGITMRCIIRGRPPVVTLYDTITFITGSIVIVCVFLERLTRQRIALGLATVLGASGMFLAMRYELKEIQSAGDTMASVVAVLDTNYYLAIHVTTITLGYSGGLLAGAIAHVWIFGQLLGYRAGDTAFYKGILRMVYGIICFTLLFAIFGTIMGGVWANDSWGRFWGWDPKENGALLICIWGLLILHMRMGGYIQDRGLAMMAVFGGVVVSASWWGVNLLNVGLHSYGFTSGVGKALLTFWAIEGSVLLVSGLDAFRKRTKATLA